MKKKAIEKVAFLGLPGINEDPGVKFIGVTAFKNIAHERHLFLEVYKNDEAAKDVPVMRIVVSRKDFGTYTPGDGSWTRARLDSAYYGKLPWEAAAVGAYEPRVKRNILRSPDDLKRIQGFFPGVRVWDDACWWDYIAKAQGEIAYNEKQGRLRRKREKRQQALKDRMENTPELPGQEILSWADRELFKNRHYLYYKKKGRKAAICCSACGGVTEAAWKAGDPYESRFERTVAEPVANHFGECPMCGASGVYKPQGRADAQYSSRHYVWKADRYKGTGAVARYIGIEKRWVLEELVDGKGRLAMNGAYEKLECTEVARAYFYGGKAQTDFQKHDPYKGEDFWDDCNLSGLSNITLGEAPLYPGFSECLEGTAFQYSAIGLYAAEEGSVNAMDYLWHYQQTPQIEMLVKLKLYGVVKELLRCHYGIAADIDAGRPEAFLGIRKERLKFLVECQGDVDLLSALQMEKRMGQSWTDEQVEALAEIGAKHDQLGQALRFMGLQKVLNLVSGYAGCGYGTGCASAESRLRNTAQSYFDYIGMRLQLGYDMGNTVYQKPRSLQAAHDKMMLEINRDRQDRRLKEAAEKYPLIRKNYRKLRNLLLYEDGTYIIRPARSAEEIVMEGRLLHHCVGGDRYLENHNKQASLILMLRFKEEPEVPYITVELRDGRIMQWYGAHDKKPDEKNMQRWLDAYVTRLQCAGDGDWTGQGTAIEIRVPA